MLCLELNKLPMQTLWVEGEPDIRQRAAYLTHWLAGACSSAAVYIELEPGASVGRHRHSSEEVVLILEGEVIVTVGDESRSVVGPAITVAPALVRHDLKCVGEQLARCVGFWSSSSVISLWDKKLAPGESRRVGTPIPEDI